LLYFSAGTPPLSAALYVEPSGGGDKRRVTDPPTGTDGDFYPSVSPDGRQLVFVRSFDFHNKDLFVADLRDGSITGSPRRLTSDGGIKVSPLWTTDGEASSMLRRFRHGIPCEGLRWPTSRLTGIAVRTELAIASKRPGSFTAGRSGRKHLALTLSAWWQLCWSAGQVPLLDTRRASPLIPG
jgi:hypothetical protein